MTGDTQWRILGSHCCEKFQTGRFGQTLNYYWSWLNYFQLFLEIKRKTSDSYGIIIRQPKIEFCRIYAGLESFLFVNVLINDAKSLKNGLLEICARAGVIISYNISYSDIPAAARWPTGNYKIALKLFDDIDDNIFNLTSETTIFNWFFNLLDFGKLTNFALYLMYLALNKGFFGV